MPARTKKTRPVVQQHRSKLLKRRYRKFKLDNGTVIKVALKGKFQGEK